MSNNELVLLDQVLQQRQTERATPIADDYAFELFACGQALREHDLSADEIADGVVGGGNDGGLDGIYVFLGDVLLTEDSDLFQPGFSGNKVPARTRLELWMVQAKRATSFTETAVEKVANCSRRLGLTEEDEDLQRLYAAPVVTRTGFFRKALRTLAARHPQVEIHFVYATRGRSADVNMSAEVVQNMCGVRPPKKNWADPARR